MREGVQVEHAATPVQTLDGEVDVASREDSSVDGVAVTLTFRQPVGLLKSPSLACTATRTTASSWKITSSRSVAPSDSAGSAAVVAVADAV